MGLAERLETTFRTLENLARETSSMAEVIEGNGRDKNPEAAVYRNRAAAYATAAQWIREDLIKEQNTSGEGGTIMLQKGDLVMIYSDPISKKVEEGQAVLVDKIATGFLTDYWRVRFLEDGHICNRWVMKSEQVLSDRQDVVVI